MDVDLENEDFEFFRPDKTRLDEECVNQPKIVFDYIRAYEESLLDLKEVETELDLVKAIIDPKIRANPTKYKIPKDVKITEAVVTNTLIKRPRYKEALKKVRIVQHKVGILRAAVKALEHKGKSLENLVKLHGQNYFSTPRIESEEIKEVIHEAAKKQSRIQGKKRKRDL